MKSTDAPVFDRVLEPIGRMLTPEVARQVVEYRFDRSTQAEIDKLARKCSLGKLTAAEHSQYASYVALIDFVAILQAKARKHLSRSHTD